jgi:hypothetical protein
MAGPMVFDIILMLSAIDAIMAFTPFLKGTFVENPFYALQLSTGGSRQIMVIVITGASIVC